jgi:hypothetical protein
MVVGAGIGGAVSVGGKIIPVGGGVAGIVEPNGPGGEELSTVHTTSSTSSSPSGTPTPYNIYPRPGSTAAQLVAFERNLNRIAQPGTVTSITGARNRLLLWTAKLTPVQASELHQNPVVSSAAVEIAEYSLIAIQVQGINEDRQIPLDLENVSGSVNTPPSPNCPPESCSHKKRDGNILVQLTQLEDLRQISQAREAQSLAALPGYVFDSVGGMGITVYVMDSGINPNHPVSVTYYQMIALDSLISRNSELSQEAYVGSICRTNHMSKVI